MSLIITAFYGENDGTKNTINYDRRVKGEKTMVMKIVKIEDEFTVVELKNGEKKVCPTKIFPKDIRIGCVVVTRIVDKC